MKSIPSFVHLLSAIGLVLVACGAQAQSFRVQCPTKTTQHPGKDGANRDDGSAIKCQQIAGGDGYATMGDGNTIYLFGFGPLSGLHDIYNGLPGTQLNGIFNTTFGSSLPTWTPATNYNAGQIAQTSSGFYAAATSGTSGSVSPTGNATVCDGAIVAGTCSAVTWVYQGPPQSNGGISGSSGDFGNPNSAVPNTLVGMPDGSFKFNGAIGLTNDYGVDPWVAGSAYPIGAYVRTQGTPGIYLAKAAGISGATEPTATSGTITDGTVKWVYQGTLLDGHVDARPIMDVGVMNANQPAPLIAIDEDDELFLTLTNVGMIMRPDLFEQHTVHFHGYPNASAFYDGVPDASIAIAIGGSFSYYYLAPDAGTYFWHCHISPPEHLQMGMVGQLYVRPRQNRVLPNASLWTALYQWETATPNLPDPSTATTLAQQREYWEAYEPVRKRCGGDILCSSPIPASNGKTRAADPNDHTRAIGNYAYNDGDGSTYYDVEYPIQIHGFDPNFHFVGMTFNPESFNDMKDKYFLLNGRSYPDTVGGYTCGGNSDPLPACVTGVDSQGVPNAWKAQGTVVPGPMETVSSDGTNHASQPLPTVINIPANGKALLRISDLDVSEYQTLASLGIPMKVVGLNARLLRDLAGNNLAYNTNSITLAGGESIDVILDAAGLSPGQKFYLFTPQLDHLSNDAENFGGLMTEVNICTSVDSKTKVCKI